MNTIKNSSATENNDSVHKAKRKNFFVGLFTNWKQFIIFLLSLLIFPVLLVVYATIIPTSEYKPAAEIGGNKSSVSVSIDNAQKEEISRIINLEKERDFEKNRLTLATQDSIYLVINVPAHSMAIEIKGVQVRTATILRVEPDQKLALFSHEHTSAWLSDPFILRKYFGTIPKIPIVIKDAPKDTIEAQKLSSKPLPPDSTIVLTSLYFDRNLIIEINQDAEPVERELAIVEAYKAKKLEYLPEKTTIEKLLNPGAIDQPLTIKLFVSAADVRAIYRAIPSRTSLVLKL
jgi:hypothetical protein